MPVVTPVEARQTGRAHKPAQAKTQSSKCSACCVEVLVGIGEAIRQTLLRSVPVWCCESCQKAAIAAKKEGGPNVPKPTPTSQKGAAPTLVTRRAQK